MTPGASGSASRVDLVSVEDGHHLVRQRAAVGVAQDQRPGPGLARGAQGVEGIAPVGLVAVEEVLRVVDHLAAAVGQERHRFRDHVQVLGSGRAQDLGHVQQPALAEDGHDRRLGRRQLPQVDVLVGPVGAVPGGPEGGQPGGPPGHRAGRREELDVLGIAARPAALDVGHAVLVEHPRDAQLVRERQRDVLALGAVPEGRVVQDDRRVGRARSCRDTPHREPLQDRVPEAVGAHPGRGRLVVAGPSGRRSG